MVQFIKNPPKNPGSVKTDEKCVPCNSNCLSNTTIFHFLMGERDLHHVDVSLLFVRFPGIGSSIRKLGN